MENVTLSNNNFNIVVCCPHDLYFATEIEIQCNNFRKFGYSHLMQILVFEIDDAPYRDYWDKLAERYNEVQFFFYALPGLKNLLVVYPPVCRPAMLKTHYKRFPKMSEKTIWYIDSDVLLIKPIDFSKYLNDDICYLSKTDYIGAKYFENKKKDVLPFKLPLYETRDILNELCRIVGIDKQVVVNNEDYTGGCQYLLKGIDSDFWADLERNCVELRLHCLNFNAEFFISEEKGLQSWAIGDMCGLLWNLWKRGKVVVCPEEFNFVWASSPIENYETCSIFHNAGISKKYMEMNGEIHKMFNKAEVLFRTSSLTFFDMKYDSITEDYCTIKYVEAINSVENPICVTKSIIY